MRLIENIMKSVIRLENGSCGIWDRFLDSQTIILVSRFRFFLAKADDDNLHTLLLKFLELEEVKA